MIDYEKISLKRIGKNRDVFIIPSLSMDDPDCELLFFVADCLDDIAAELREYAKEVI